MSVARRIALFSFALIGVDFLDELASGIPGVGAPDVQVEFDVSYGMAAGWVLTAFGLLAVVLEPPLFLLADRHPRRWFVCGGLLVLGLSCLVAAAATSFWIYLFALLLFGPASGIGVGLSQATLMDANRTSRERMMMRWTLSGELGDLAAPLLLAGLAAVGLGWRAGFLACAVAAFGFAAALWRQPYPAANDGTEDDEADHGADEAEPSEGLWRTFRRAMGDRALRPWILGVLVCDLLDELVVAFGALYLRDVLGLDIQGRALVLASATLGGVLGLVIGERLLARFRHLELLLVFSLASGVCYAGWLFARDPWLSAALFFAVGFFTSSHYPIAKAQAYHAMPEHSGTVNAVLTVAGIVHLPIPILLGWVADTAGLVPSLALLGLQPAVLACIALTRMKRERE